MYLYFGIREDKNVADAESWALRRSTNDIVYYKAGVMYPKAINILHFRSTMRKILYMIIQNA